MRQGPNNNNNNINNSNGNNGNLNNRRPRGRNGPGGPGPGGGGGGSVGGVSGGGNPPAAAGGGGHTGGHGGGPGGAPRRPNVPPIRHQTFDSNGPDVRIRGSAFQINEKYLAMARDASSSGDRIAVENYLQHAEHYFRIHTQVNEALAESQQRPRNPRNDVNDFPANVQDGNGTGVGNNAAVDTAVEIRNPQVPG